MGKSNRTAALERNIELLPGEREQKVEEIAGVERLIATVPLLTARIIEIDHLIGACEAVIQSDQPDWTRDDLKPSRPFVHKVPVRPGNCSKMALDVLRLAEAPMRVRDIAVAILKREGHDDPDKQTIIKVASTVGASLKKKLIRGYVATDGAWPGLWGACNPALHRQSNCRQRDFRLAYHSKAVQLTLPFLPPSIMHASASLGVFCFHYESHAQLRTHLADFMAGYNFARRLNTLNGLTPYQHIAKIWTAEPDRLIVNPIH